MRPLINPIRVRSEQEIPLVESRVNGGMITTIDATDIENSQFQNVKNFRVREDRTIKRNGHNLFSPAKPDSQPVLLLTPFKRFDKSIKILRLTPTTVNTLGVLGWSPFVGALTGGPNDRFSTTVINDRFFFANGVDPVQELLTSGLTFGNAGNWGAYKFITGSFNRIVGADLRDVGFENPVRIAWSGDLNFLETNPAVDFSAGFEFLVESPSDYADFITGLVGFPSMLLIPKERSIWGGIKQPSASNPFQFQTIIPGIGCDCPYSVQKIPQGIAWVDYRTASVYTYVIGQQLPTPIGRPIERTLIRQISDPLTVFSDYNGVENEYSVCIPVASSNAIKVWTFNFRTSTWVYDEMENISALNSVDYSVGTLMYDDLQGPYDGLVGSYDSLNNPITTAAKLIGETDGDILIETAGIDTDNGTVYEAELASKKFTMPDRNSYFNEVKFELLCTKSGEVQIQYKRETGSWVTAKTLSITLSTENQLFTFKKNIKARQFEWRLLSTSGLFEVLAYDVFIIPGARSKR